MRTPLLILLAGCSAAPTAPTPGDAYTVVADATVDDATYGVLGAALAEWTAAVPALRATLGRGPCPVTVGAACVTMPGPAAMQAVEEELDSPHLAEVTYYDPSSDSSELEVFPIGDGLLEQVLAHELGHAFGLVHAGAGTVMCASTGCQSATPTAADVAQYESLRGRR